MARRSMIAMTLAVPTLGYPLVIEVNLSQQAVDGGIVIRASDLTVNQ